MEQIIHGNGDSWLIGLSGVDVDESWDRAKDIVMTRWGMSEWAEGLYADDFPLMGDPRPEETIARRWRSGELSMGVWPVANARDWSRKRFRVRSVSVDVRFPQLTTAPSEVLAREDVEGLVDELLAEKDIVRGDGLFEKIDLVSYAARYKVNRIRIGGASSKRFVVLDGDEIVSMHDTLSLAKLGAKQAVEAGRPSVGVYSLGGREGGEPLARAEAELVRQRMTLAGSFVTQKGEKNRLDGFFFVGGEKFKPGDFGVAGLEEIAEIAEEADEADEARDLGLQGADELGVGDLSADPIEG